MKFKHGVDLGKSFDELKETLFKAVKITNRDNPGAVSRAFGLLETGVKKHLEECTDKTFGEIQKELDEHLYPTLARHTTANENVDDITPLGIFNGALNWDETKDIID